MQGLGIGRQGHGGLRGWQCQRRRVRLRQRRGMEQGAQLGGMQFTGPGLGGHGLQLRQRGPA